MIRVGLLCAGGLATTWALGIALVFALLVYAPDIDDVFWTGD